MSAIFAAVVVIHSLAAVCFINAKNWYALVWVVSSSIWAAHVYLLKATL